MSASSYPVPPTALTEAVREARSLTAELRQLVASVPSRPTWPAVNRGLSISGVQAQTDSSRSALYKMVKDGTFPAPFHIGRSARWLQRDVDDWLRNKSLVATCHKPSERGAV